MSSLRNLSASLRAVFSYPPPPRADLNASLDALDKVLNERLSRTRSLDDAVRLLGRDL